jgi:Gametolysin peptidase M11
MLQKHRLTLVFGLLSLASFMLWGISAVPGIARAVDHTAQSGSQRITLNGLLTIMRGDPPPNSGLPHQDFVFLQQDDGRIIELQIDLATASALNGKQVEISGVASTMIDRALQGIASESFYVESAHEITPLGAATLAGTQDITGSRPWVTLLCRFADSPHITPHPPEWYQGLFVNSWGGIDHYWRQMSYDLANIDDPNLPDYNVKGWYNLPFGKSYYMTNVTTPEWDRILKDCAAAADADVYFPDYTGINLMLNVDIGCCAWGGTWDLTIDGESLVYSMTWIPPWAQEWSLLQHEMGHGFGLPHSSGPYDEVYDSDWDVMSGGGTCNGNNPNYDPDYGCPGVGTIAYHLDKLGWIPVNRKAVINPGSQAIFTLERLRKPISTTNYLMAQIPIGGSADLFYTVEARKKGEAENYDLFIPADAVVIHEVDISRRERAHVVDGTNNGNPNDAGAMWTLGESFIDPSNGIRVSVVASGASSYDVFISYGHVNLVSPANNLVSAFTPEFRWTTMGGATSYELQIATNAAFSSGVVTYGGLLGDAYTPVSLSDGVYYWRARAMTGSAAGDWSAVRSVTIETPAPAPVYYTLDTPTLTWGRITWATGYQLQIDDNSNLSSPFDTPTIDGNTLEYTTQALVNGTYYWRVRALPNGDWSAIQRFEVGAP